MCPGELNDHTDALKEQKRFDASLSNARENMVEIVRVRFCLSGKSKQKMIEFRVLLLLLSRLCNQTILVLFFSFYYSMAMAFFGIDFLL